MPPGTYKVSLQRRVGGVLTTLGAEQTLSVVADPAAAIPPAARTAAADYQDKVAKLQRSFTGALEQANNMRTRTRGDPARAGRLAGRSQDAG